MFLLLLTAQVAAAAPRIYILYNCELAYTYTSQQTDWLGNENLVRIMWIICLITSLLAKLAFLIHLLMRFTQTAWRDVYSKIISVLLPWLILLASTKPAAGEQQENNFHVRARRLDFIIVFSGEREEKFPPPRAYWIQSDPIYHFTAPLEWALIRNQREMQAE